MESLSEQTKRKEINDLIVSKWVDKIVNQFPEKIDLLKFAKEWSEVMFNKIKWFYYFQFALYLVYTISQYFLLTDHQLNEGLPTWAFDLCIY